MSDSNGRRVSDVVVAKIAKILTDAKHGNIEAVAFITVGPDGVPRADFAGEADLMPSINLGVDLFKAQVIGQALSTTRVVEHSGLIVPKNN